MKRSSGKTPEIDIIVVGSGASGLAAALTAVEGSAKVLLLEKMAHIGGVSNFAEGLFAVESEMQRQSYINYTRDGAFKAIMDYSHWKANPRLVRAFVDESARTIEWLQKQGVKFIGPVANMPDGLRTWHVLKGHPKAIGSAMIQTLMARAKEKGVDLKTSTAVKKILRENGRITGVITEKAGKPEKVDTRAVIVACGGYGNNKEWVRKYTGLELGVNVIPATNIVKEGDGIRMAWEVGAAEEGMGVLQLFRAGPMGSGIIRQGHLECAAVQPSLWVNQRGERFCDESITFNDTFQGNAIARLKEGYSYTVFDEVSRRYWMEYGIERSAAFKNLPGTRLANFDIELKRALEKGNGDVFVAGSIHDLALRIKVNPTVLKTTIDEYNSFCDKGHDDLFAKDPKYLRALKKPNYYAVKAYTVSLGSLGGIRVNYKLEVLDKDENIIPGLYAVGTDAGGLYGDSYNFQYSSGATLGFAVNSGRIAGWNALNYIDKEKNSRASPCR
jgi:fumarate reductase flavoprotein subunit